MQQFYKTVLRIFILNFCVVMHFDVFSQIVPKDVYGQRWVDSIYQTLSQEERIAQLIIIRSPASKKGMDYELAVSNIKKHKVGGVCFFKGIPSAQVALVDYYQSLSKIPLWFSCDGEWGLAMRLDSIPAYPRQLTLGAVQNDTLIYAMGVDIAQQMKRAGLHLNYIPCVDICSNRDNIIGNRSFGEDPKNVARKAYMYMKALQDNGIYTSLKHFPGHGNTNMDSHRNIPVVVKSSRAYLDSIDLYPYKYLIERGADGIMTGHFIVPAYDNTANALASLSFPITTGLLREELGFQGIIYTDGLEMQGITQYYSQEEIAVRALVAGADVLLLPMSVPVAINAVKRAMDKGTITPEMIEEKCKKILTVKYNLGLNAPVPSFSENYKLENIVGKNTDSILRAIYADAITLLSNQKQMLPLKRADRKKIAGVTIKCTNTDEIQKSMDRYARVNHFSIQDKISDKELKLLKEHDFVIISMQGTLNSTSKNNFGISNRSLQLAKQISKQSKHVILVLYANPYIVKEIESFPNVDAIIVGYQATEHAYQAVADKIFGQDYFRGKLPVAVSEKYPLYSGFSTKKE